MRLETTYKYLLPHSWNWSSHREYYNTSFYKRQMRRAGRHQANLDTRAALHDALEELEEEDYKDTYSVGQYEADMYCQYEDY